MTAPMSTPHPSRSDVRPPDDDDLCHIACCVNDDLGLCGTRLYVDSDDDVSCVVCEDLETNAPGWCPILGTCPP